MARVRHPKLIWKACPKSLDISGPLQEALDAWEGTPYESGQRFIQRGADCIGAVFGVIDRMDGRERGMAPTIPHDTALHRPDTARAAMKVLLRAYAPAQKLRAGIGGMIRVMPGDIVVMGERGGGPGHVGIVGARKNTLWHAIPGSGFHQGGWGLNKRQTLHAVYRILDRERWLS